MGVKRFIIRAGALCCVLALGVAAAPSAAAARRRSRARQQQGPRADRRAVVAEGRGDDGGGRVRSSRQGAFGPPGPVLCSRSPALTAARPSRSPIRSASSTWPSARRTAPAGASAPARTSTSTSTTSSRRHDRDGPRHHRLPGERPRPRGPGRLPGGVEPVRAHDRPPRATPCVADAAGNDLIKVTPDGHAKHGRPVRRRGGQDGPPLRRRLRCAPAHPHRRGRPDLGHHRSGRGHLRR